jgi:hypothetical protein
MREYRGQPASGAARPRESRRTVLEVPGHKGDGEIEEVVLSPVSTPAHALVRSGEEGAKE